MSRIRNFNPTGRPPKKPGGCIAQVTAYLTANKGGIVEISKATEYSASAVETAITRLRKAGSPLVANVVDGRENLRSDAGAARPRKRSPKRKGQAGAIQEVALSTRTPLEEAWNA